MSTSVPHVVIFSRFSRLLAAIRMWSVATPAKVTKSTRFYRPVASGEAPALGNRSAYPQAAEINQVFPELPNHGLRRSPLLSYFSLAVFLGANSNTRSFLLRRLYSLLATSSRCAGSFCSLSMPFCNWAFSASSTTFCC